MPLEISTVESLADSYSQVIDRDGRVAICPRIPSVVGNFPWEWCVEADREACRENFIQACMFRKEGIKFQSRVELNGRVIRVAFQLFPLETGQVLCLFSRVFEGTVTTRERHVLALLAGGASTAEIAETLAMSESTARDHIASLKKKLNISHPEGFRLAAQYFGLMHPPECEAG
jgi:DNA-binding NarL/FixJ family response regulator